VVPGDECTDPGGVDERHVPHIHDDRWWSLPGQVDQESLERLFAGQVELSP
jgi:hypothetical protein